MAGERRYIPASEFCESVRDGTHDSPKPVQNGRQLVTSRHLTSGRLDLSDAYLISQQDFEAINKRSNVDQWDVLISMIGTVGEPCLIREKPDFAIKNIGLFKTKSEVDGKWLYYYLRSRDAQQSIREQSRGTTQQYIPLGALRKFPVLLCADPREQKAIVEILGTLDDKIELNRRMNATLEAMARALFQSWFLDFDPVHVLAGTKPEQPPFLSAEALAKAGFPNTFQESEIGPIPKGWRVGKLGEVASNPRRGVDADEIDEASAYIALEHMPRRCIALTDWGNAKGLESNKFAFKKGEILFGKLRPYFHKIGVAPLDGVCSTDILVVTPTKPDWFGFVLCHVSSVELVNHTDALSTGTKMPRTKWQDIAEFDVPLPSKDIAAAFTKLVNPLVTQIILNVHQSHTLITLRDTLLPKLLSGELSATQFKPGDLPFYT